MAATAVGELRSFKALRGALTREQVNGDVAITIPVQYQAPVYREDTGDYATEWRDGLIVQFKSDQSATVKTATGGTIDGCRPHALRLVNTEERR